MTQLRPEMQGLMNAWSDRESHARRHYEKISKKNEQWCGREDLNLHGISPTATSTLRVYQFRHDRILGKEPDGVRTPPEEAGR